MGNRSLSLVLTCAFILVVLTCAPPSSSASRRGPELLRQVTDDIDGGGELDEAEQYENNDLVGSVSERKFIMFMEKYGKSYGTRREYLRRLGIFAKNLVRAAEHQVLDPTAVHGVTPFSDLSEQEFEEMFLGVKSGGGSEEPERSNEATPAEEVVEGLPESFDWRDKGAVTDVKMQGKCGSCWAFSTCGVLEGAHFISTGKLLSLSEQQLIDCDHTCDAASNNRSCDDGCHGGLMTTAFQYLMASGGLQEEASYPYTGKPGECRFDSDKIAVRVSNFTTIPFDEDQIAAHLVRQGPLAVGLNAVFMQTYIGGVSCPLICRKRSVNHGVLLVGYGAEGFSILRLRKLPYWIIKNSWGKRWGEEGYYRLCRGHGVCGINTMVSSAVVAQP